MNSTEPPLSLCRIQNHPTWSSSIFIWVEVACQGGYGDDFPAHNPNRLNVTLSWISLTRSSPHAHHIASHHAKSRFLLISSLGRADEWMVRRRVSDHPLFSTTVWAWCFRIKIFMQIFGRQYHLNVLILRDAIWCELHVVSSKQGRSKKAQHSVDLDYMQGNHLHSLSDMLLLLIWIMHT